MKQLPPEKVAELTGRLDEIQDEKARAVVGELLKALAEEPEPDLAKSATVDDDLDGFGDFDFNDPMFAAPAADAVGDADLVGVFNSIADSMEQNAVVGRAVLKALGDLTTLAKSLNTRVETMEKSLGDQTTATQENSSLVKGLTDGVEALRQTPTGQQRLGDMFEAAQNGILSKGLGNPDEAKEAAQNAVRYGLSDDQLVKGLHAFFSDDRLSAGTALNESILERYPKIPVTNRPKGWYEAAYKGLGLEMPEE